MPRWEYIRLTRSPGTTEATNTTLDLLSKLGAEGWEMCGIEAVQDGTVYWLKRPEPGE